MADDNPQKFTDLPLSPVTFGVRDKFPTISRTLVKFQAARMTSVCYKIVYMINDNVLIKLYFR